MACDRYLDALSNVAAGSAASTDLEAHLAACEPCRAELAVLRQALAVADQEIARLLAVEPRPGLVSRIHLAVTQSEPERGWRPGWVGPALAAAAVLVVALAVILTRPPAREPAVAAETRPPRLTPAAPAAARESTLASTAASGSALAQPPRPSRPAAPAEPEVLVPPGETEALLRLVTLVHHERLTPAVLGTIDRPVADLAELRPIDIKPLEIVPLDPAESSGT